MDADGVAAVREDLPAEVLDGRLGQVLPAANALDELLGNLLKVPEDAVPRAGQSQRRNRPWADLPSVIAFGGLEVVDALQVLDELLVGLEVKCIWGVLGQRVRDAPFRLRFGHWGQSSAGARTGKSSEVLRSAGSRGAACGRVVVRGVRSLAGYVESSHMATRSAAALKGERLEPLLHVAAVGLHGARATAQQAPPAPATEAATRRPCLYRC